MVQAAVTAKVIKAIIQPMPLIKSCAMGANKNCPKEPPALMKPAAKARRSGGRARLAAAIIMAKLPAPAPADTNTPKVSVSAHVVVDNGANSNPSIMSRAPKVITLKVPMRSESNPNKGCDAPHMNWPTAKAKLTAARPNPVLSVMGAMKSPKLWRSPMVIMRTAAAKIRMGQ